MKTTYPCNYDKLKESGSILPIENYDKIIVAYSGGKDCTAATLQLLEMGVPREKIELWHQHIDGVGQEQFMDWPCTESYCRAAAKSLGITIRFQWKDKGFLGEMLRQDATTNGVWFEDGNGQPVYLPPGKTSKKSTRMKFPQVSADLSVRWCSAYLKIDVAKRAINNDPRLNNQKILFITGERRQESAARSKYEEVPPHPCNRDSRTVHQWRMVIDWSEEQVWDIIKRWKVIPHPAYLIGWNRVSCMTCIFGEPDQWASVLDLIPERVKRIYQFETQFGLTIKKGLTVLDQANKGKSFLADVPTELKKLALSENYPIDWFFLPDGKDWVLPLGAYKRCGGPT